MASKPTTTQMFKRTVILTFLVIILCFGAVIYSLVRWQLIEGAELKTAAVDQSLSSITINASRGSILDCNGSVLAESADVWTVALEPTRMKEDQKEVLIAGLAEILGMDPADVRAVADKQTGYAYLKRKIETETKDRILQFLDENDITAGIDLVKDYKRYYPYGSTASVVLGFTGTDNQGLYGVEYQYDTQLSGTPGRRLTSTNARGEDMPYQYEQLVQAKDGDDLTLTLDVTVQAIVEKYMKQGVIDNKVANGAVAVVMDVNTGAIKALVSLGDFDPNSPFTVSNTDTAAQIAAITDETQRKEATSTALNLQWRNKAVSDTYYPGSVFKIVTGSAGLEEGVITPTTTFNCVGYNEYIYQTYGLVIRCHKQEGHGTQVFSQALCNSCNPFFMNVGRLLGPDNFFKYFAAFGFTEKTGIDLPGETNSVYYNASQLNPVELATESFGQNFSITPIQMITAACAVANGGYLVQPHVVEKITDSDGNIVSVADTSYKRAVISQQTSSILIDAMHQNATIGTAKNGYVAGYRICGKTGTSEKVDKKTEDGQEFYIASYCGFAPADDPQYALLVFFDEPMGESYYGGAVAGPVFAGIMSEILPYLGVTAQYTQEEASKLNTTAPNVTKMTVAQAKQQLQQAGLECQVIGSEDEAAAVISQVPSSGSSVPKDGKVVLYTTEESLTQRVSVPDFTNMSLQQVLDEAARMNLQINIAGAALQSTNVIAYTQDHESGQQVAPGEVIMVYFIEKDRVL